MNENVQLQIMSDLHLETPKFMPMYSSFEIIPRCQVLALVGDIGNVYDTQLFDFLEEQLRQFRLVLYVLGNHEPYGGTIDATVSRMKEFEASNYTARQKASGETSPLGQFVLMNRRRLDLSDEVTVLGCTLFSHIAEEQQSTVSLFISDFSSIRDWSVAQHNSAHDMDLAWLNTEVQSISQTEPHRSIVILTHHSPTTDVRANDPEHLEDNRGVNSAFMTDLAEQTCWTSAAVKLWAFGHTHHNCDYIDDKTGTRVISNQRGHGRGDIFNFDANLVASLPAKAI